jgi:hypothetical protein
MVAPASPLSRLSSLIVVLSVCRVDIAKAVELTFMIPGLFEATIQELTNGNKSSRSNNPPVYLSTYAVKQTKSADLHSRSFSELLLLGRNSFRSLDPRDKVYAMLGMVDLRSFTILPDYSKSVAEVYTEATVTAMRLSCELAINNKVRLRILAEAQRGAVVARYTDSANGRLDNENCPSWIPRYYEHSRNLYFLEPD